VAAALAAGDPAKLYETSGDHFMAIAPGVSGSLWRRNFPSRVLPGTEVPVATRSVRRPRHRSADGLGTAPASPSADFTSQATTKASVMGGHCPAGGINVSPALTFGYIAGCEMAGVRDHEDDGSTAFAYGTRRDNWVHAYGLGSRLCPIAGATQLEAPGLESLGDVFAEIEFDSLWLLQAAVEEAPKVIRVFRTHCRAPEGGHGGGIIPCRDCCGFVNEFFRAGGRNFYR
jgi:hypothetical protein